MKLLKKDSSKRADCGSQKGIEYISNVVTDSNSETAINSYTNNSLTDIANRVIIFFIGKAVCYVNN